MKRAWRGPTLCPALGATALSGNPSASTMGVGCKAGAIAPLVRFSVDTVTVSNPRRVGLGCKGHEGTMLYGWSSEGERNLPHGPAEGVSMKWLGFGVEVFPNGLTKAQCLKEGHGLRGCNGDAQRHSLGAGPLAKWGGITTPILR